MNIRTIKDLPIQNARVLIRVDFNVPIQDGKIQDDARIAKTLPSLQYALQQKAKVILMSHLGRPEGTKNLKYTLKPAAEHLSKLLGKPVVFIEDCVGPQAEREAASLQSGEVALLENLRFHKEEEADDAGFAKSLARLADFYIDDAFGAAHRAHASVTGITKFLPSAAGFLLAKEIEYFEKIITNPDRPFAAILGGAKVSDKIKLIDNLLAQVDILVIAGGMSYTFHKALGHSIGTSILDEPGIAVARQALEKAKARNVKVFLPVDYIVSKEFNETSETQVTQDANIPDGWMGMDAGPKTVQLFNQALAGAKTILWNGPVGVFEMKKFEKGSRQIAEFIAGLEGVTTIIGGGDTASA
ncbi:MAG: phosphoglycerate kinase, partial [Candidatus Omnitrophica bacterium]|nr:phosphoglycerate kinase [Candidatus Omnitrophota bacterium]